MRVLDYCEGDYHRVNIPWGFGRGDFVEGENASYYVLVNNPNGRYTHALRNVDVVSIHTTGEVRWRVTPGMETDEQREKILPELGAQHLDMREVTLILNGYERHVLAKMLRYAWQNDFDLWEVAAGDDDYVDSSTWCDYIHNIADNTIKKLGEVI